MRRATADLRTPAEAAGRFLRHVLEPFWMARVAEDDLVEHLLDASLRGIDSHGLRQIIGYTASLGSGRIRARGKPRVRARGAILRVDGDGACGQHVARWAMTRVIDRALERGFAMAAVVNSNHFGAAGYYVRMAAERRLVAFATSDTNVVDLAPFGGREARVGNNPFACGIPTGNGVPFVLDGAAGVVSGGKIAHFRESGLPIPAGWAIGGSLAAVASPKASGLALAADLLCGPLLGTAAACFKRKELHDSANGTGHLLMAIDVSAFTDFGAFVREVDRALRSYKRTPPLERGGEVLYPGEPEARARKHRLASGIPIPAVLLDRLTRTFGAEATALLTRSPGGASTRKRSAQSSPDRGHRKARRSARESGRDATRRRR